MQVIGEIPQAVTAEEFKRAIGIDQWEPDHDLALTAYLVAAQEVVEVAARRPMTPRSVTFTTWAGMGRRWWLPVAPVAAVTAVAYDDGAAMVPVASSEWRLVQGFDEPQLVFTAAAFAALQDIASLEITATVGPDTVPRALAQAVILLAKDWFDTGMAIEDHSEKAMNFGCRSLIKQQKYNRPREWAAS